MERLKRLIVHIIREVRDAQGSLTKTKLVKLLYLIDVETYRAFRRTITGARWIFFLYGPFAAEIDNALNGLTGHQVAETEFLSRGRRGYTYQTDEDPRLHEVLSLDERLVVQDVLHRWADEELNQILEFVYFKTPPMTQARFGAPLDFSSISAESTHGPTLVAPIPRAHVDRLRAQYRARIAQRRAAQSQMQVTTSRYDDLYWKNLKNMDEEEIQDIGILRGVRAHIAGAAKDSLGEQS